MKLETDGYMRALAQIVKRLSDNGKEFSAMEIFVIQKMMDGLRDLKED